MPTPTPEQTPHKAQTRASAPHAKTHAKTRAKMRRPSARSALLDRRVWRAALGAATLCLASVFWFAPDGAARSGEALKPLAAPTQTVIAEAARLEPTRDGGVRLVLAMNSRVQTQVFTLDGPDRVVVDFPEVAWRFSATETLAAAAPAVRARGVAGLRVARFREGRSRLVLDLDDAMEVGAPRFDAAGEVFSLTLTPKRRAQPASAAAETTPEAGVLARRAAALEIETTATPTAPPRDGFVIALDPGHGGVDPGATYNGIDEKTLVLDVALILRDRLEAAPAVTVVMTRDRDVGLRLDQRVEIAREARADLFVSIHADALPEHPELSGAAFYTLADKASDAYAERLAERENKETGLEPVREAETPSWARQLLVDYAQRRSLGRSHDLVERLIGDFRERGVPLLGSKPHREAGFRVLRSFDQPSLLVELGFLTNLRDQRRFSNPAWRDAVAQALATAILRWRADDRAPDRAGELIGRVDG